MKTSTIANNKKLPSFITSHEIFSQIKEVKKIFPLIGLKNSSMSLGELGYAQYVAPELRKNILSIFGPSVRWHNRDKAAKIRQELNKCTDKDFIQKNKVVVTPKKLRNRGIRNLKEAYYSCMYSSYDIKYARQDDSPISLNPLSSSWRVAFSSSGNKGVWDIATMSMRGIDSCQSWDGSYRRNLIGSIIDPFVGVIYLTDGDNYRERGAKMLHRAVVRYVVHRTTGKPAIFLESVYSYDDDYDDYYVDYYSQRSIALKLFKLYLKKNLSRNIDIITSSNNYVIPSSTAVQALDACDDHFSDGRDGKCLSYRDSGIAYSKSRAVHFSKIKAF